MWHLHYDAPEPAINPDMACHGTFEHTTYNSSVEVLFWEQET